MAVTENVAFDVETGRVLQRKRGYFWRIHFILSFLKIFLFFGCARSYVLHVVSRSLTRDRTQVPCTGSMVSYPLDHQGSPLHFILYNQSVQDTMVFLWGRGRGVEFSSGNCTIPFWDTGTPSLDTEPSLDACQAWGFSMSGFRL